MPASLLQNILKKLNLINSELIHFFFILFFLSSLSYSIYLNERKLTIHEEYKNSKGLSFYQFLDEMHNIKKYLECSDQIKIYTGKDDLYFMTFSINQLTTYALAPCNPQFDDNISKDAFLLIYKNDLKNIKTTE
ncbi:MAG: hypothetical protein OEZ34_13980, partial [Spirochaetia bacterium]|nr:hypothetical protein [Spirochaetia bacterium]